MASLNPLRAIFALVFATLNGLSDVITGIAFSILNSHFPVLLLGHQKKLNIMTDQVIGKIPEFTQDEPLAAAGSEEVKEAEIDKILEEEKETPTELPAEKEPSITEEPVKADDTEVNPKEVDGLRRERANLLKEITELRTQRREVKYGDVFVPANVASKPVEELPDIHPKDVEVIEKVLKSRGYVPRQEIDNMFYQSIVNQELEKFYTKYPEYKPSNDTNNQNWDALNRELAYYRKPDDPKQYGDVLERAHKARLGSFGERELPARKQRVEIASVGAGGTQRSSTNKSTKLTEEYRNQLRNGGWSEADIKELE